MPGERPARASSWCRFALALLAVAAPVGAQTYLGPSKCVQCHDHDRQAAKWQREEPLAFKGKAHFATLKQLDGDESRRLREGARRRSVRSQGRVREVPRGRCSAATRTRVSPARAATARRGSWNELHQQKGSYAKAVAPGCTTLRGQPAAIARVCVECHVLTDRRLAAAGHPTGDAFDAGLSLQKARALEPALRLRAGERRGPLARRGPCSGSTGCRRLPWTRRGR
jgi:hypothetical protein